MLDANRRPGRLEAPERRRGAGDRATDLAAKRPADLRDRCRREAAGSAAGSSQAAAAAERFRQPSRRGWPASRRTAGLVTMGKSRGPVHAGARVPLLRGSRRLVLPDQSAQFPQEQHRLTAPWRLLLAGRRGTEAGVRIGRRRSLSGKAWQAGASREVNVPVEEKVPLVVLLVRVVPLSSWLTGLRQRPAARGAAASFPGLPPPYRDGETAAIGARGF